MRASDLHAFCLQNMRLLDDRKRVFVAGFSRAQVSRNALTDAQAQYLQACYDFAVSRKYGIEQISTDKEFSIRQAILKKRRGQWTM